MAKEVKEKIGEASPDNINKVKISCVAQEKIIGKDGEKSIEALKNMGTVSENMTIPASTNEVRIEKNGNKETIERIGANGEVVSVTVVDLKSIAKTLNKADIER